MNCLIDMDIIYAIDNGFERNIVVYDIDSYHKISKRLLSLMVTHSLKNGIKPTRIILNEECYEDVCDMFQTEQAFPTSLPTSMFFKGLIMDFIDYRTMEFYSEHYRKSDGSFNNGNNLIFMVDDDYNCLLGIY